MDAETLTLMFTIGVPCIFGVVWLVRLEGRINTAEQLHKTLREDVSYIRERIDAALNGVRK